jgi:hypothetical protein
MRRSLLLAATVAAVLSCGDSLTDATLSDANPPRLDLEGVASGVDTVLSFSAEARDNLGLKTIQVRVTGGVSFTFDTTFTSAVTSTSIPFTLGVPRSVPAGTSVTVIGFATDGSGNRSPTDTLRLAVGNIAPPSVRVTSPLPPDTVAIAGKSVEISLAGSSELRVRYLGYETSGVLPLADSAAFETPLRDTAQTQLLLSIPEGTAEGDLFVTPFLYDSLNQRSTGPAITLVVQTAASAGTTPVVTFGITSRVEVTDTIRVQASDPAGITSLGYEVRRAVGGPVEAGMADSASFSGQITSVDSTFTMQLPVDTFSTRVFVQAFARNSNGTRSYALLSSGDVRIDTVDVVAGATQPLPDGGVIADALYHPTRDRLYLTNIDRNRVEVFDFATSSFITPGISVGSRPWGITAWPIDRTGTMDDRLLVANSGGTSISYVDLSSELVESTYALPNIVVSSITTVESATAPGTFLQQRTRYDFSDRPQYLAATCRGSGTTCGDVILVYSTTPTGGQSVPFPNQGSVRWENLTQRTSHFFFEQAMGQTAGRSDTLVIERFSGSSYEELVPYRNEVNGGPDSISIVVDLPKLAFRDTTFVRNSGNFRRAILGEGGPVLGSRALMYDATDGLATTAVINGTSYTFTKPLIDLGVSRAEAVSDFIANTFARVRGAAINFDGGLAAIRGDSTYLLDPDLRLQGTLQTSGGNPGFDFHPLNGDPDGPDACFAFAASTEPVIEVYENRHFSRVKTIPVRDPIIGPIKAARRPTEEIVLVGATVRGVVIVTLPRDFVSGCP